MTAEYLTFSVASEEYAIGVGRITQIMERQTLTHVPEMTEWMPGVVNIRGAGVPVVDLGARFGVRDQPLGERACIIVVEMATGGREAVGLLADTVTQVIEIPPGDVQPPPPFGTAVEATFLKGLARAGEKFILLLDVDRILPEGLAALQRPTEGFNTFPS